MCEECNTCHDRTGRPVVAGQSNPLFLPNVMKTLILLTNDPAQEEDLLQRYQERIGKVSQQDRVIKICTDAGFLTTFEVGQCFMTEDTEEFSQFTDSVACREYTLPRDESSSEPKGWIRGNTKIGPALEVTTCCLQGKYRVEIRIQSFNKDNSHPWVRISHGLNKLVTNLNNNKQDDDEQETSEMQFEDYALKSNARAFASRSKAKAKTQRRFPACSSTRTVPVWMGYLLSICGTWRSRYYVQPTTLSSPTIVASGKLGRDQIPKPRPKMTKEGTWLSNCLLWIMYPLTHILLKVSSVVHFFEDNEAVVKMLAKGRSPNNETRVQNPQSCSWLFDRINLDP